MLILLFAAPNLFGTSRFGIKEPSRVVAFHVVDSAIAWAHLFA
jgi:hypothetical protein